MPAAEEITNRAAQIGVVKILRQVKAKEAADRDGNIGVAREVKVQVERKCDECRRRAERRAVRGKVAVGGEQRVGEDEFLHKSARKAADRVGTSFGIVRRGEPYKKSVKIKERPHRHRGEKEQIRDDRRGGRFHPHIKQKADGAEHKKGKPHRREADRAAEKKCDDKQRGAKPARHAAAHRKRRESGEERQEPCGMPRREGIKRKVKRKQRTDARPRGEHTIYGCRRWQAECKESQRNETHGSASLFSCIFFPYII